ncbi:hypothetical protein Ddye_006464 [Dipteronia dyeriana]|uniref:Uncharacterized protein n=1 Tax=Dipteronia dyeriana TaxID=168575 RepID=A0AAD9XIN9_9ROSI|nr:hypothetical protein Ddye_006464 [Dipteronia dyeriana]
MNNEKHNSCSFSSDFVHTFHGFHIFSVNSLRLLGNYFLGKPMLSSSYSTICFFNPDVRQLSEYKKKYKINCIVEDNKYQTNFLIIWRAAKKLLGISCQTLVME